jgi:citrate lyase beta subunit
MRFYLITNQPSMAAFACAHGVDRIVVDLEIIGKRERQGHLNTLISNHSLEDVFKVRQVVPPGALMVRVNPLNESSASEIDELIQLNVDVLMLPMFRSATEVKHIVELVKGRARLNLLVETVGAMNDLESIVQVPGVDEVHIGLNDLHLELGCHFMFEPIASGMVDVMAAILRAADLPFGIGGIARVGEGLLPAELLLAEHARLGSSGAILSRTFHRQAESVNQIVRQMNFGEELEKLRQVYEACRRADAYTLAAYHDNVQRIVAAVAKTHANNGD